jgi:hypothetical protein
MTVNFRKAYDGAAKELESLLEEQERIEIRILRLRQSLNALATLVSEQEAREGGDRDKSFTQARQRTRELVDTTLTDDIYHVLLAADHPLTTSEIRHEMKKLGGLAEHKNPLATISAILARLYESGRVREIVSDGRKAWKAPRRRVAPLGSIADYTKWGKVQKETSGSKSES